VSAVLRGSLLIPGLTWILFKSRPINPKMKVPIAVIKCANFGGAKRHKSVFGKGFYGLLVNTKQDVKNT